MNTSSDIDVSARKLVHGWLWYAITAAAIAGTLAFAVAMTRTPGVRLLPSARAFQVILVGHVTFALTIWLLTFIATAWNYVAAKSGIELNGRVGWFGMAASLLGAAVISIPILTFQGEAVMNDYVPLLDTPLFFTGFVIFLSGIGITAANYLAGAARREKTAGPISLTAYGMGCAAAAALTAIVALGVAAFRLGIGESGRIPADYFQAMFWGMGHSLQYVSVATMVVVWYSLVGLFIGDPPSGAFRKLALILLTLFAVFPLVTPLPYFLYEPMLVPTKKIWGIMLDVGLSLPVMALGPMLLIWIWRAASPRATSLRNWIAAFKKIPWGEPRVTTFVFSAALFAFGLSIHPAVRQGTLRTPAHYHSVVVGGVTLAFMGLAYHLLSVVGRSVAWRRTAIVQPYLFALGLTGLVAGLLGAGDLGAPRKTYDAAVTGAAWLKPMVVMGIGAGIAALGGALFVAVMMRSLLRKDGSAAVVNDRPVLAGVTGD